MSNTIKCHTIQEAENHINRLDRENRAFRSQITQAEARARIAAENAATQRVNQVKLEMEIRHKAIVSDLQTKIEKEVNNKKKERLRKEKEYQEKLEKQSADFYDKLNQEIKGVRNWTKDAIQGLEKNVNQQLDAQKQDIKNIRQQVRGLYEREADAETKANNLIKDIWDRLDIVKNSQHQKFIPGRLNQIIAHVQSLVNSTDPAPARIAIANTALNDIWDLEDNITRAQTIFETLRQIVMKEADAVIIEMSNNRKAKTTEKDENGNEVELEIDFWTDGKFSKLEDEARNLKKELEERKDDVELNEERLKQIGDRLSAIREEQNKLREETINKGFASQRRAEISHTIVNKLIDQGFKIDEEDETEHNYMGGKEEDFDFREGVIAHLQDANGTDVTVVVESDENLNIKWGIQRNDEKRLKLTDGAFSEWHDKITEVVDKELGIKSSKPIAPQGTNGGNTKIAALANPKAVVRKGGAATVKQQLSL
ncbi:hypothetical protein FACS1894201_02970 [Bacteroidia bacterium]|nr:hypothetical protein FACS1894201_02970 [Bacteroidia bacterium]